MRPSVWQLSAAEQWLVLSSRLAAVYSWLGVYSQNPFTLHQRRQPGRWYCRSPDHGILPTNAVQWARWRLSPGGGRSLQLESGKPSPSDPAHSRYSLHSLPLLPPLFACSSVAINSLFRSFSAPFFSLSSLSRISFVCLSVCSFPCQERLVVPTQTTSTTLTLQDSDFFSTAHITPPTRPEHLLLIRSFPAKPVRHVWPHLSSICTCWQF